MTGRRRDRPGAGRSGVVSLYGCGFDGTIPDAVTVRVARWLSMDGLNGTDRGPRDGLWTIAAGVTVFLPLALARLIGPPYGDVVATASVCLLLLTAFLVSPIRSLAIL